MTTFDSNYYDCDYFSSIQGKEYRRPNGSVDRWGYRNPDGYWEGCHPIAVAWKDIFKLEKCDTDSGLCKSLDFGAGRGQFVWALRQLRVEAWGFDFSQWAIDNRYKDCEKGWTICHDATNISWPYGDKAFDLVLGLDIMEHLFESDINNVISEMYRVSKKWIFLQIATIGGGSGSGIHETGYILKRGENIPIELEGVAVAGHVTVQPKQFWIDKLMKDESGNERKWKLRDDLVAEFIGKVDNRIIDNWIKNAILILEKI